MAEPTPAHFRHFDGMCWPVPCERLDTLEYCLRYDREITHFSMKDRLLVASVIAAYKDLIQKPNIRRNAICKELRLGQGSANAQADAANSSYELGELRSLPGQSTAIQSVIDPVIAGLELLAQGKDWPTTAAVCAAAAACAVAARAEAQAAAVAAAATAADADADAAAARRRQRDLLLRLIREAPALEVDRG